MSETEIQNEEKEEANEQITIIEESGKTRVKWKVQWKEYMTKKWEIEERELSEKRERVKGAKKEEWVSEREIMVWTCYIQMGI